MNRPLKLKSIGILGGMTSQATVEYYREINAGINSVYGGHEIAETIIIGVNFGNIEYYVRNGKWDDAKKYLLAKALQAQAAGADVLVCASNTMHKVLGDIEEFIDIPFIHIASPVVSAAQKLHVHKIGLLGTLPVMKEPFISDLFTANGIDVVVPPPDRMGEIDRIIFDETSKGLVTETSKKFLRDIVEELVALGARGIVLACTELFMIVDEKDFPGLPVLDTTKLHVEEIVRFALGRS